MEKRKSRLKNSIERVEDVVQRAENMPWDNVSKQKNRGIDGDEDSQGRKIYAHSGHEMVVIVDPTCPHSGTAFRPNDGVGRFMDMLSAREDKINDLNKKQANSEKTTVIPHPDFPYCLTNYGVVLLSGSILIAASAYEWDPGDTGYSAEDIKGLYDRLLLLDGPPYVNHQDLSALSHAHDLAIEKAGIEEYYTITGDDFSEALALQEKLHAHLAGIMQEEV